MLGWSPNPQEPGFPAFQTLTEVMMKCRMGIRRFKEAGERSRREKLALRTRVILGPRGVRKMMTGSVRLQDGSLFSRQGDARCC